MLHWRRLQSHHATPTISGNRYILEFKWNSKVKFGSEHANDDGLGLSEKSYHILPFTIIVLFDCETHLWNYASMHTLSGNAIGLTDLSGDICVAGSTQFRRSVKRGGLNTRSPANARLFWSTNRNPETVYYLRLPVFSQICKRPLYRP